MSDVARSMAIVGIGNNLLTDDGAGIHALERVARENDDEAVDCIDGGTVGLALLDRLANLDGLVALDAMILGKPPGSVTVLQGESMDTHLHWGTEPTEAVAAAVPQAAARARELIRAWRTAGAGEA